MLKKMCGQEGLTAAATDGSHYDLNMSTQILPALGARTSDQRVMFRGLIISPYDSRYRVWEAFLVLLMLYTAWVLTFEFAFLQKPEETMFIIDNVVNGFFVIDIILTFFIAYIDKNTYLFIDDHKKIAWKYALLCFAFGVFVKLVHYFPDWRRTRSLIATGFAVQNSCVILYAVHCAGCFYYHIAAQYPDPKKTWIGAKMDNFLETSLWIRYLTSISAVGNGDLDPVNSRELMFNLFYKLFSLILMAYVVGNLSNLVVQGNSLTRNFRDAIQAASSFAQRNMLPHRLQDQMLAHISLKFRTKSEGLQVQETLDSLPKAIRSNISQFLFCFLVQGVYLFHGVSRDLLLQLVSEMKAEYFAPREDIIMENEAPTDFYIFVSGAADLLVFKNGHEQVIGEVKPGDLCGEIGVLCYIPQPLTVRTKRLSQLLRMNRTTFMNIVRANVEDGTIIMHNLLQYMKDFRDKDAIMEGILLETEDMIARGKLDLPISLCFAALHGNDFLLHQLLKRGLDPNKSDSNGRSALQVAASIGSENCVSLLLDYGADPNFRDCDGNVPLWEAIQRGHNSVTKILMDKGADLQHGDVGQFACTTAEQNNLSLLTEIVRHGGDISTPRSDGTTALHVAVTKGNVDIVRYLLDQGADMDRRDTYGLTPRDLADQLGLEEIKAIFQSAKGPNFQHTERNASEPNILIASSAQGLKGSSSQNRLRRRANNFHKSLFGVISAAQAGEKDYSL